MNVKESNYVPLKGTRRSLPPGVKIEASNLNEVIEVTVRVRGKKPIRGDAESETGDRAAAISRSAYAAQYGASKKDLNAVITFAHQCNLTVTGMSAARKSVFLKGTVQFFSAAFRVNLSDYQDERGKRYRGRIGEIAIPKKLSAIITGVFGLDNREQAKPMSRLSRNRMGQLLSPADAGQQTYSPRDIADSYGYPLNLTGAGECIALIELEGGYRTADLDTYFASLQLATPVIIPISVGGQTNNPSDAHSDGEVVLDIEVAGAVAPGANIVVYFANNDDQGFLNAISAAINDDTYRPSIISISWTSSEDAWSQSNFQSMEDDFAAAKKMGISVLCASGDQGSANGDPDGRAHVGYPASSSYVLACGGTQISDAGEVVWHDPDGRTTGGGISELVPQVPTYQQNINLPASVNPGAGPGRGVPDIAGNASGLSGYSTYIDGGWYISSGTSAVAPLTAALLALANQQLGRSVGFIHDKLYAAPATAFRDVVSGDNITADNGGYTAAVGWDACTGLGIPLGGIIAYL
jgi:kumamolisin